MVFLLLAYLLGFGCGLLSGYYAMMAGFKNLLEDGTIRLAATDE